MTAAYEKVLGRMSADDLLAAAKEAALKQLDKLYGSAKKNYKDITEQLDKLYETQTAAIEACTKSADTDTVLDQFSAGVVDLLIRARVKTGMTIKELSSTLPEVTAAYKELTAAQKTHLANGKKLTDAQNLLATYERDLESLNQWVDSDTDKYSAVKTEIGKLATETRTKLEGCTDAAGMAKVLNDYSAGVARLLLEKLNFTAGKTTLGELNKLSQVIEQASAAISGLTKEQKELLDEAQVASCAAAKELLAVYTKAVENLNKWSSEDQNKYTDLKTPLNSNNYTVSVNGMVVPAPVSQSGSKFGYSTYLSNEGANTITITATDADGYSATRSWTVYYENGDITVTVSVEATTVGLGYLVSPTEVTVPGGTDAWSIVEKVLTENGYGISGSGSYLSALQRSGICSGFFIDPELMDLIVADGMDENGAGLDPQPFSMDSLGEFDFYRWSGWMYSYNGSYPGYGMNVCKPQDGSVIRVRYTLALGKDIGGFTSASGSYGVSSGNYYKEW